MLAALLFEMSAIKNVDNISVYINLETRSKILRTFLTHIAKCKITFINTG